MLYGGNLWGVGPDPQEGRPGIHGSRWMNFIAATQAVRKRAPDLCIDGEVQLDTAVVPGVAERKAPVRRAS